MRAAAWRPPGIQTGPAYLARPVGPHPTRLHCPTCGGLVALGWTGIDVTRALGSRIICELCVSLIDTGHLEIEVIAHPYAGASGPSDSGAVGALTGPGSHGHP
jgi:hypothetical protein